MSNGLVTYFSAHGSHIVVRHAAARHGVAARCSCLSLLLCDAAQRCSGRGTCTVGSPHRARCAGELVRATTSVQDLDLFYDRSMTFTAVILTRLSTTL